MGRLAGRTVVLFGRGPVRDALGARLEGSSSHVLIAEGTHDAERPIDGAVISLESLHRSPASLSLGVFAVVELLQRSARRFGGPRPRVVVVLPRRDDKPQRLATRMLETLALYLDAPASAFLDVVQPTVARGSDFVPTASDLTVGLLEGVLDNGQPGVFTVETFSAGPRSDILPSG